MRIYADTDFHAKLIERKLIFLPFHHHPYPKSHFRSAINFNNPHDFFYLFIFSCRGRSDGTLKITCLLYKTNLTTQQKNNKKN